MSLPRITLIYATAILFLSSLEGMNGDYGDVVDDDYDYGYDNFQDIGYSGRIRYHRLNPSIDRPGKVAGGYRIRLPDHRLILVEYVVSEMGGFIPRISIMNNTNAYVKSKFIKKYSDKGDAYNELEDSED